MVTFQSDLKRGETVELQILSVIQQTYPEAYKVQGKQSDYDIFIPERDVGVEVKADFMSQKTGNIVVEVNMYNKPSALSITKAEFWVFYTGERWLVISPSGIRECIVHNALSPRKFVARGDTVAKTTYLVKQTLLEEYAKQVTTNVEDVRIW
jgi:hypothetical protein